MNYHNITKSDMLNGDGLRVVLWVSGCEHHCEDCHNKQTWCVNSGIEFDEEARNEIFEELDKDYISGVTFSGGDPLHKNNEQPIKKLIEEIKLRFPSKTIWMYTGYYYNDLLCKYKDKFEIVKMCDVLVDGEFIKELENKQYKWAGSVNQSVINIKESIKQKQLVLWQNK